MGRVIFKDCRKMGTQVVRTHMGRVAKESTPPSKKKPKKKQKQQQKNPGQKPF